MEKIEEQSENKRNGLGTVKATSLQLFGAKNKFEFMNTAGLKLQEQQRAKEKAKSKNNRKMNRSVSGS